MAYTEYNIAVRKGAVWELELDTNGVIKAYTTSANAIADIKDRYSDVDFVILNPCDVAPSYVVTEQGP